jgi:hypothetical protein
VSDAPELRLIAWPYDRGIEGAAMGSGAARLADDDALRAGLAAAGWRVARARAQRGSRGAMMR